MLSRRPSGLITDVDGTIAPIAPSPDEARVSPLCRSALETLTSRLALVAAISGRDALKAREMLALDGVVYVGSHGLDRWRGNKLEIAEEARKYSATILSLEKRLLHELDIPGLIVENKGISIGIHYRLSPEPHQVRESILRVLDSIPEAQGLLTSEGKLVIEIRPPVGIDKGTSLKQLVMEYSLKGVIYLGDDVTDVDAFRALHALSSQGCCAGLALGVLGQDTPPELEQEADLLLQGVPEVEKLLQEVAMTCPFGV